MFYKPKPLSQLNKEENKMAEGRAFIVHNTRFLNWMFNLNAKHQDAKCDADNKTANYIFTQGIPENW